MAKFFFLLGLATLAAANTPPPPGPCLTDKQTSDIIARWTSLAIKIDPKVVDATVTNDFKFFSDSQDFLEGMPVRRSAIEQPTLTT